MSPHVGCVACLQLRSLNSHSWAPCCACCARANTLPVSAGSVRIPLSFPWALSCAAPQTRLSSSGIQRGLLRCSGRWLEPSGNTRGLTPYLLTQQGCFSSCWGWWLLQQLVCPWGRAVAQCHGSIVIPEEKCKPLALAFGTGTVEHANVEDECLFQRALLGII